MPELPEVENVRGVLEPQVKGLPIENVTVSRPEVVAYPAAEEFCRIGRTVSGSTLKWQNAG